VKLAKDYSDLDTSDIDISCQNCPARKKKTSKNNNFAYSSASDDSDQNNNTENQQVNKKIKTLPAPPPLPKLFIVNKPTNNEVMQSEEVYPNKNMNKESFIRSSSLDTPGKS